MMAVAATMVAFGLLSGPAVLAQDGAGAEEGEDPELHLLQEPIHAL